MSPEQDRKAYSSSLPSVTELDYPSALSLATCVQEIRSRGRWTVSKRQGGAATGRKGEYREARNPLRSSTVILKITPKFRPALLQPAANKNIRMVPGLLVLDAIGIRHMARQLTRREVCISKTLRQPDHNQRLRRRKI